MNKPVNPNNPLTLKERMQLDRQPMPECPAAERAHSFTEVNQGYDPQLANCEAMRCLSCAKPTCVVGCPVGVKVKDFIDLILAGDYLGAAAKIREDNVLPAITGRVCPQEDQCEGGCVVGRKKESIGIGNLERFVADYEQRTGAVGLPERAPRTGKRVAIIGSGPAGLSCAGDLVQRGHEVRVFEALHELGGVLAYGIPEFRLPRAVLHQELRNLEAMGVEFETNVVVGRTVTIDDLLGNEGYHAIFVATGAGLPQFMKIPGEDLNGVYSANEFLTRVNLMRAYRHPDYDQPVYDCRDQEVAVVGGGNTALDAARTALRMGARTVNLIYRRSAAEMPARKEEVRHAVDEGIHIMHLTNPVAYLGDERVRSVRAVKMALGEPDESGRRRPMPVEGSEFEVPASIVIVAVGTTANPLVQATTPGLATTKRNYIVADPKTLRTSREGVFAGGDIVTGGATVILAMGAGRKAAQSVHEWLTTGVWQMDPPAQITSTPAV
ncbi:MAG: NADPH-dependent glutamate synthase [Candidatus Koribacter versatilis]|uniref:NADPH-dependent glutamate synthase n=1 Tax=Candidatus Korobacter versatilis TaxID=658062 RepID=A0A932A8K9_9BACT|nr:NADPH-dependent glutamate synthase [Candidatus Koribacter versatilis]